MLAKLQTGFYSTEYEYASHCKDCAKNMMKFPA